jgi:hypothetical protein|nr:MAG TPA: replication initiator protein [Caudoviricetes sp.]
MTNGSPVLYENPLIVVAALSRNGLSIDDSFLYAFLVDSCLRRMRAGLEYRDKNGMYTILKQSDIAMYLGKSERTIHLRFKNLKKHGLIEIKQRGLGLPARIYLKCEVIGNAV